MPNQTAARRLNDVGEATGTAGVRPLAAADLRPEYRLLIERPGLQGPGALYRTPQRGARAAAAAARGATRLRPARPARQIRPCHNPRPTQRKRDPMTNHLHAAPITGGLSAAQRLINPCAHGLTQFDLELLYPLSCFPMDAVEMAVEGGHGDATLYEKEMGRLQRAGLVGRKGIAGVTRAVWDLTDAGEDALSNAGMLA